MHEGIELKANLGLVVRGEVIALKAFTQRMDGLISESRGVQLVHKHLSASKLWINEGDGMNDGKIA
jgi:hypothetical protein